MRVRCLSLFILIAGIVWAASHPLEPLSKEEIAAAAEVLKRSGKATDSSRFPIVVLREPPKQEVLDFKPGAAFRREVFVEVLEREQNRTFEAVVDLNSRRLVSWKPVPGVQPEITLEELKVVPEIVRADARWQEAMKKRGISDFEHVQVDPWSVG